nr:hypothetical protein [Rhodococcus erythropolis]
MAAPYSITSTCSEPEPTDLAEPEDTLEEFPPFVLIEPEPESGVEVPGTKAPSVDGWLNRQWRSERRPIIAAAAAAAVFLTVSGVRGRGHHRTHSDHFSARDSRRTISPAHRHHARHCGESARTVSHSATSLPSEVPALGAQPTAQSWSSDAESTSSESQPIPASPGTGTEKSTTANVPRATGIADHHPARPLRIENLPPVVGPLNPVDPATPDTPAVTDPTDTQTTPTQPSNPTDTTDPVVPNPDMPVMPLAPETRNAKLDRKIEQPGQEAHIPRRNFSPMVGAVPTGSVPGT